MCSAFLLFITSGFSPTGVSKPLALAGARNPRANIVVMAKDSSKGGGFLAVFCCLQHCIPTNRNWRHRATAYGPIPAERTCEVVISRGHSSYVICTSLVLIVTSVAPFAVNCLSSASVSVVGTSVMVSLHRRGEPEVASP